MATEPKLYLITGIRSSGKSTVARALAERFPLSVHVRGDMFADAIVSGRVDLGPSRDPEALAQLRLRHKLAMSGADDYAAADMTTVVEDMVIGPLLDAAIERLETRPMAVIVLAPTADEVKLRDSGRAQPACQHVEPSYVDNAFRKETPRRGLWLDTTGQTVDETVDEILARADESRIEK